MSVQDIGNLDDSAYIRDVRNGCAAIEVLVQAGLFVREREVTFEHTGHTSDVEAWLTHHAEAGSRSSTQRW